MSFASDDDVAANRKKHADGSQVSGPVVASAITWTTMLSYLPAIIPNSDASNLRDALVTLSAPPG